MAEDKIIKKLIEHDLALQSIQENMVTKYEFNKYKDKMLQTHDEIMVILKRLDQERIFTTESMRRIEAIVEQHSQEISKIKQQLKIA